MPIGSTLALVACLSHGGLAHWCFIDLGYVPLPWMLPYGDCHGLGKVSTGVAFALAVSPLESYFPK